MTAEGSQAAAAGLFQEDGPGNEGTVSSPPAAWALTGGRAQWPSPGEKNARLPKGQVPILLAPKGRERASGWLEATYCGIAKGSCVLPSGGGAGERGKRQPCPLPAVRTRTFLTYLNFSILTAEQNRHHNNNHRWLHLGRR